jgi:hypothetical protein
MVADWALVAVVVAFVVATFFALHNMIDSLIEYWRAHREEE